MSGIKFYSGNDMSCSWMLDKIVEKINSNQIENDWNITDLLDFYNILKYIKIERFKAYILECVDISIDDYVRKINKKIGVFIGLNGDRFLAFYDELEFDRKDEFFEIIECYKIYKRFDVKIFRDFIKKENVYMHTILKFRKLVDCFDEEVKVVLIKNPANAKIILSKHLGERELFLPNSLSEKEKINLIDEYIKNEDVNINVLREIVHFPSNRGLYIPDKIKLKAKRKISIEEEKIFSGGCGIKSGVKISYPEKQDEAIELDICEDNFDMKISRNWIEENLDYPTLWNNFIYLFGFVDRQMRLELDSKKSESSSLESLITPQAEYLYFKSRSFSFKEMKSSIEIISYIKVLNLINVSIENMIEWFFYVYIKDEFQVNNFIVKMPSEKSSYFEKCRTVLPEIDRIFKQYNMLVEDGEIDQELIQISSSSVKFKDIKSLNKDKYLYSSSNWYKTASFLLFSDQSMIFYLRNKKKEYCNFFDLMRNEEVTIDDFEAYQLEAIQWLFDNNIIYINKDGIFEFVNKKELYILKELYYKEVISYWHCDCEVRMLIEELRNKAAIEFEESLFSKNEQDYLDYYLNKSKFTNGYDIRNRYLHGTNTNDEKQHEIDYYLIIKLLVVIIIKINDDLCIREDCNV